MVAQAGASSSCVEPIGGVVAMACFAGSKSEAEILLGLTEAEFVVAFALRAKSMWLSSFAMYGDPDHPRYAGIWVPLPGGEVIRPQNLAVSLNAAEVKGIGKLLPQYVPMLIGATGGLDDARFSLVLVKGNAADYGTPSVFIGQSLSEALANVQQPTVLLDPSSPFSLAKGGAVLPTVVTSFAVYDDGGTPGSSFTLATIKSAWPSGQPGVLKGGYRPWNLTDFDTPAPGKKQPYEAAWESAPEHKTMRSGWARPEVAIPIHFGSKHLTLWRTDTYAPFPEDMATAFDMGVHVVSPVFTEDAVCQLVEKKLAAGFAPLAVGASEWAGKNGEYPAYPGPMFGITFRPKKQPRPLPKRLVVLRAGVPTSRPLRVTNKDVIVNVSIPHFVSPTLPPMPTPTGLASLQGMWFPSDPAYGPLDNIFVTQMREEGIHCTQWAAAKNDKPVAGSAYTWAEEGYPLVTPKSPMPIDSCSKALTGMAVVRFFATGGDKTKLGQSIFTLLGIDIDTEMQAVNRANAKATTLDDCLYMTTGFAKWIDGAEAAVAKYGRPNNLPPALPGDETKFFLGYPKLEVSQTSPSLWDEPPPGASRYEGAGTRLMSELLGRDRKGKTERYADAMLEWWGLDPTVAYFPAPTPAQCLGQGTPPQHARRPGVSINFLDSGETVLVPNAYEGNGQGFGQGSGGWTMSAMTTVKILMAMSQERVPEPKVNWSEIELLAEVKPPGGGRHFGVNAFGSTTILSYGGGWTGSGSLLGFSYQTPVLLGSTYQPPPLPGSPTWAIAAMFNQPSYGSVGSLWGPIQSLDLSLLPSFTYDQA